MKSLAGIGEVRLEYLAAGRGVERVKVAVRGGNVDFPSEYAAVASTP